MEIEEMEMEKVLDHPRHPMSNPHRPRDPPPHHHHHTKQEEVVEEDRRRGTTGRSSEPSVETDKLCYEIFSVLESKFLFGLGGSHADHQGEEDQHDDNADDHGHGVDDINYNRQQQQRPQQAGGGALPSPSSSSSPAPPPSIKNQRGKVCILSIDGGAGMCSILIGKALVHLQQALRAKSGDPEAHISSFFDVAAGTGVGGIFTAMLFATGDGAAPLYSADDTWRFLVDQGQELFLPPSPSRIAKRKKIKKKAKKGGAATSTTNVGPVSRGKLPITTTVTGITTTPVVSGSRTTTNFISSSNNNDNNSNSSISAPSTTTTPQPTPPAPSSDDGRSLKKEKKKNKKKKKSKMHCGCGEHSIKCHASSSCCCGKLFRCPTFLSNCCSCKCTPPSCSSCTGGHGCCGSCTGGHGCCRLHVPKLKMPNLLPSCKLLSCAFRSDNGCCGCRKRRVSTTSELEAVLKDMFGEKLTLRDTLKPVLIPCYDLRTSAPFLFLRADAMEASSYNFRLWEVCRATWAEPGRLDPAEIVSVEGTTRCVGVDGGLVMSNPAAAAITHVLHNKSEFPFVRGVEDLMVLSLGAVGSSTSPAPSSTSPSTSTTGYDWLRLKKRRGKKEKVRQEDWARPIIRIASHGTADLVDQAVGMAFNSCRSSSNYVRIQPANRRGLGGISFSTTTNNNKDNCCINKKGSKFKLLDVDRDPGDRNVQSLLRSSDEMLKQKNVESVLFGGMKRVGEHTNAEVLEWLAGRLVTEHQTRSSRIAPTVAFKQLVAPPTSPNTTPANSSASTSTDSKSN